MSIGERKEHCRSTDEQAASTYENIGLELTHLIFSLVIIDQSTDQRIVYCVPDLHEKQKDREKTRLEHHIYEPEGLYSALKREAHVTTEVSGSIRNFVANAKLAVTVGIKFLFFFHC